MKPTPAAPSSHAPRVRTTRLAAFDGVEVRDATYARRQFPAHFHDVYSIGLVVAGRERLDTEDTRVVVSAGTVIVLHPGQIHAHGAADDAPWRYRAIYVSPDALAFHAQRLGLASADGARLSCEPIDDDVVRDAVASAHVGDEGTRAAALTTALDRLLLHHAAAAGRDARVRRAQLHVAAMDDAAALLRERFAAKVTVPELSARFRMPEGRFVRAFRARHGLTPGAFQMALRMNEAREALAAGEPVVAVAMACGFYDQSHFVRFFKRYVGTPPSEFKRRCGSPAEEAAPLREE